VAVQQHYAYSMELFKKYATPCFRLTSRNNFLPAIGFVVANKGINGWLVPLLSLLSFQISQNYFNAMGDWSPNSFCRQRRYCWPVDNGAASSYSTVTSDLEW